MRPVKTFHVKPALPERLAALEEVAYNLRWSWDHETISLFRRLDRDLWEESGHNPVLMLGSIRQERLQDAAQDEAFLAHLDRVAAELHEYVAGATTWHRKKFGPCETPAVAYFSMEFGLTECLPIYSGGLGMLAGDHLKSASELGDAAGRRRPPLPEGLLPAVPDRGRLAAGALPGQRLLDPARAAVPRRAEPADPDHGGPRRPPAGAAPLARARSAA